MKTILTLVLALFMSISSFAQQGINYKAVIKDNLGNVVANQNIDVKFSILQGSTDVYIEFHTQTTDANGIIILIIGEGAPSFGVFNDLDWASDDHFLKVELDIERDGSFVFLGTTQFKTVPYALQSKTVLGKAFNSETGVTHSTNQSDDFVFGSTQLDNDGSETTDDSKMFFNKSKSAFRAGLVDDDDQWNDVNLGLVSTAFGNNTVASGDYSFAGGFGSFATNFNGFAFGDETVASGVTATAFGKETKAESYATTTLGRYNVGGGNPTTWQATDPLFEVGNGTNNSLRSNALTILKNGTIIAPTVTNALIDIAGDKSLITKEYMALNGSTGLELITENGQTGWRLRGRDPIYYDNVGNEAVDLSYSMFNNVDYGAYGQNAFAAGYQARANNYATAIGYYPTASGEKSLALGSYSVASGDYSFASGFQASATGELSIALGNNATASGTQSFAFGNANTSHAIYSTSFGLRTNASSYISFVLGRFNIGGGNPGTWIATDPLFEIGNGVDESNRSNALTVLKNGTITAPTLTNTLIDAAGNKALITKEYADVNYKSTDAETKSFIVSASAFNSDSPDFVMSGSSARISSGNDYMFAPVSLPIGATVTEVKVNIYDNDAVNNISISMIRASSTIIQPDFTMNTVGSSSLQHVLTWSNPVQILDDYQYYFSVRPSSGTVWSGSSMSIIRIRITYTE